MINTRYTLNLHVLCQLDLSKVGEKVAIIIASSQMGEGQI